MIEGSCIFDYQLLLYFFINFYIFIKKRVDVNIICQKIEIQFLELI